MQKLKIFKIIVVFAAAAAVFTAAAALFYKKHNENTEEKLFKEQQQLFRDILPYQPDDNAQTEEVRTVDLLAEPKAVNPQTVAWITIPDTDIDFPIVQCEDNSYYLSHDFECNESYMGAVFLDSRSSGDFSDFNSVIYGHNISGKYMFAPLLAFKDKRYFDSHGEGELVTSDKIYKLKFAACAVVKNDSFAYDVVFLSKKDKLRFVENLRENAVCLADFSDDDIVEKNLVTISTCSYEFDDARTILVGYLEE